MQKSLFFVAPIRNENEMQAFEKTLADSLPKIETYLGRYLPCLIPNFPIVENNRIFHGFENGNVSVLLGSKFATVFIETPSNESEGE